MDVACMYDCFTYTVRATMEGFGFCEPGTVGEFFAKGHATHGGDVVVNPHGGLLSEGYIHRLNHHYEAALQLRSQAENRQVTDARLAVVRCTRCRTWQHPPTETCRHCAGPVAFEPVSGRGTIYSFIVVRQATVPGHQVPYAVALVELAEQADIRITGVVRVPLDEIRVGLPVKADVVTVGDSGQSVVEFITA
nr:OB-fold domain-containing protein [Frankia sp. QA3]